MKPTRRLILSIAEVFFLFCNLTLPAQTTVLSAGGTAAGNGGSADYSVGQAAFLSLASSSGMVTQGVQQPYEILFLTGMEDQLQTEARFEVYPMPADAELHIRTTSFPDDLSCQLRNITGQILIEEKLSSRMHTLDVRMLAPATYFLTILDKNKSIATWKIIKK